MGLGADDSGAFRVAPAGKDGQREVRLPPKPPVSTVPADSRATSAFPPTDVAPTTARDAVAAPIEFKRAPNSEIRITGLPPPKAPPPAAPRAAQPESPATHASSTTPPAVQPPRALDAERWVRLPSGGRVALRYQRWAKRVSVSARKLDFPAQCPCCSKAADSEYEAHVAARRERQNAAVWTFPYCTMCLGHARSARWRRLAARATGVVTLLAVGAVAYLIGGVIPAAIAGVLAGLVAWLCWERVFLRRVAQRMASSCVCYGPAVRFAEFYGSVQHFDFANPAYADAFRRANEKKLV